MSWRFAWTPKWIVRHVLVIILCLVMVSLGFWQLRRLHEKQDRRAAVHAAEALPVAPVGEVIPAGEPGDPDVTAVQFRRATARGTYADDDSVVVDNRTYNGASGGWVLTPLVQDDGTAVIVNRGFIGFDHAGDLVPPPAPSGVVEVEGYVLPTQTRGSFGPRDPADGTLDVLARADLARYAAQLDMPILPAYLQLSSSDPPELERSTDQPELVPLDPPETDLGPHFSYAVQWAIFTSIAAGGYVLLLRKVAIDQAEEARLDALEEA
jgi:cytochrome oxidase assembly protein ShyY1